MIVKKEEIVLKDLLYQLLPILVIVIIWGS